MTKDSCSSKCQVSEEEQIDRLTNLPESLLLVILSLLPIEELARTSILSCHFYHIWKAIHLIKDCTRHLPNINDCAFLHRDTNYPLTHLTLRPHDRMTGNDLASLLLKVKEQFRSLRHLKVDLFEKHFGSIIPIIFSFDSLLSLSFGDSLFSRHTFLLPSNITLTRLKTLSICLNNFSSGRFNELLSKLYCLEDLFIKLKGMSRFTITSQTIKKLDLTLPRCDSVFTWLCGLAIPNLEFFDFKISTEFLGSRTLWMPCIFGEMPKLRKAFISNNLVFPSDVHIIHVLLKRVMNVEYLKLDFAEDYHEINPFHILLKPGKKHPMFPNLKSLDLNVFFHEKNMEDLIRLLQNCPVLESLNLIHKFPKTIHNHKRKWGSKSMLPGNRQHAYFGDLHTEEKRKQLIEWLTENL